MTNVTTFTVNFVGGYLGTTQDSEPVRTEFYIPFIGTIQGFILSQKTEEFCDERNGWLVKHEIGKIPTSLNFVESIGLCYGSIDMFEGGIVKHSSFDEFISIETYYKVEQHVENAFAPVQIALSL